MIIRTLKWIAAAIGLLTLVVLGRAWLTPSRQAAVTPLAPLALDHAAVAERLAGAVRIRTVSSDEDRDASAPELEAFRAYLQAQYPNVHRVLDREVIDGRSLLYRWNGRDAQAAPIVLMAHQDVVPVAPGTEGAWAQRPFDGTRAGGFVWGRGTWDDKGNLIAELEAVERLIADGFRPARTVYLAFGHDEEIHGRGAAATAALLQARGVHAAFILDEGLMVTEGMMPGLARPLALIGVAEKGYLTVRLRATAAPGHSSMPPPTGTAAIARLAAALARLDDQQCDAAIRGIARDLLETVGPEMQGVSRVALGNLWLFGPLVRRQMEAQPSTNAMLRTTTALTVVQGGNKENVLPGTAEATVNFRLLPGDTIETVLGHVTTVVADPAIEVTPVGGGTNPSRVSPADSDGYRLLSRTIREVFPGTVVAPGLMVGATDSRHYASVSDQIFRFSPLVARSSEDLSRLHGTNERISEAHLGDMVRFYHRLLSQGAGTTGTPH